MARSATGESVLSRVVRIFEAFTPDATVLSVSQIARRVRIGVRMWELALRASPALSLREAAMPFMEDAHAVLGHHVQLGVLDGDEVLFVERLSAPGSVINYTRIAGRLPPHASSAGLVLLAFGERELQERILARPLRRYTPNTITEPAALRAALAEVRRQEFAYLAGHVHEDALGVAVPVRDGRSRVVAALAAIVPVGTERKAVTSVLTTAARGITRRLANPSH